MNIQNKKGFTLVELIVVVTILSILSTIGFVSYSSYLNGVRDTNRISQLKAIGDSLHLYTTRGSLPTPDDKIDITTNGTNIIAYQGYVGKDIIETIGYTAEGKDPKDNSYFSYYMTKDKKYFQLMALLEEKPDLTTRLKLLDNKIHAIDYETRHPYVEGNKLGILTTSTNEPIQNVVTAINLSSAFTGAIAHLSNTQTESGVLLKNINPIANCKRLYDAIGKRQNGVYKIDPDGNGIGFKVYCDMTTDGGGWTLVLNLDTSDDGDGPYPNNGVMWWSNPLWTNNLLDGETSPDLNGDYKGNIWNTLNTDDILLMIHEQGSIKGWATYKSLFKKTMFDWFSSGDNVQFTNTCINSNVSSLDSREHLISNCKKIYINNKRSTDFDRICEEGCGGGDNYGGGIGNWHDSSQGNAFRTTSEFQSGWGTCFYSDKLGYYGNDSYAPSSNNCNYASNNSSFASQNGINYDFALFIR